MTPLQQFELNRPWATHLANQLRFPGRIVERDDVVSAALSGLWRACLAVTSEHSPKAFQRIAYPWVRGSVRDMFRQRAWVKRSQYEAGVRAFMVFEDDDTLIRLSTAENDDGFDDLQLQRLALISRAIERLDPRDRRVLQECFLGDRPLQDLAVEMGVSPPRISQRLNRAITSIRKSVRATG
jgi:RNA polymerase sigma factor (sigma-70 family)